ncbi:universal stress protein [Streptomyces sp. NBC_00414]|uniref:universal stress protein n=1 Tax=Streptomyces sp. NBC_00414 TaxID=2975739 RepID=UPI002E24800A
MTNPVVVGIDPGRSNRTAMIWASAEASRRRLPLRLVVGLQRPAVRNAPRRARLRPRLGSPTRDDTAERALSKEVAWLYSRHPELEVSVLLVRDAPVPVLRRQTRTATILVLGSRRPSTRENIFGRHSVALPVIAQAACPVVVVRDAEAVRRQPSPIVAGVNIGWDGRPHSEAVVDQAFEEAARHRTALRVLYAWHPPLLGVLDEHATLRECRRLLSETVARRQTAYPHVEVRQEVIRGRPFHVLSRESADALELVVGTRGHKGTAGQLLGRVVHQALHRSTCPVVVVPRPGGRRLPNERPRVSRLSRLTRRAAARYARGLFLVTRAWPGRRPLGSRRSVVGDFGLGRGIGIRPPRRPRRPPMTLDGHR